MQKILGIGLFWTECAELMDHIGWKWWKKQEIDIEQAQIELIDI